MKKGIFTILTCAAICFSACHKDETAPAPSSTSTQTSTSATTTKSTSSVSTPSQSSQPNDTTKGYIRVELADPAIASETDDILLEFSPTSAAKYSAAYDARTFQGLGAISLSSLSSDGILLAINTQPLLSSGTTIPLAVSATASGVYKLNLTAINDIPSNIGIWLKDKTEKDSLDFRLYPSYSFNIKTSDTTTFGKSRFTVVLRAH
jgi:hypothetical protein